ncbi:MAG: ABC transporter permease subunit [Firmicutes bacterium]|nr:ABC transporter permease subunit [Bacillota bacterium]
MEWILQGIRDAILMLLHGDKEVLRITLLTLKVSCTATLISIFIGIPIGYILAFHDFFGRKLIVSMVNLGMGFPPTVVGLWVYILIARNGPLGGLELIYTPTAIIIAQAVIASPIVMGFSVAAFQQINSKMKTQILSLGASPIQLMLLLVREARLGLFAAVMAGFGGVISEVGASMMVGGNIKGDTRVLTTAMVMEVNKGNPEVAIALSVILLALAYLVVVVLTINQQRGRSIQ